MRVKPRRSQYPGCVKVVLVDRRKRRNQWLCVRIKLEGSRDVPVYALVKSVSALVDAQTAEIRRAALRKD